MNKARYGGPDKRRSLRHGKRLLATLEYEGKTHLNRTIDISKHGVLIPIRTPPPLESCVKLTLEIGGVTSTFEGIVKRHTHCFVNGAKAIGVGIVFLTPADQQFIEGKLGVPLVSGRKDSMLRILPDGCVLIPR